MNYEKDAIKKVLEIICSDPYMSGAVTIEEGDLFGGLEEREMHLNVSRVRGVNELMKLLLNYVGTFMLKVDDGKYLFFVNTAHYGCDVIGYIYGEARVFENLSIYRENISEMKMLIRKMVDILRESKNIDEFVEKYFEF